MIKAPLFRGSAAGVFYTASFVNALANGVTGPLYVVYLLFLHFTPAQIGMVLAAGRLSIIVFEFPTGLFADRYGRKKSLLVCFMLSSVLLVGWYLSTSFAQILALSILSGLAYTFQSGAKESLMIDALKLKNSDDLRNRAFVRVGSWGNVGFVAGGVLAALLSFFALRSIWLAAAICNGVLFFLFVFGVRESECIPASDAGRERPRWSEAVVSHAKIFLAAGKNAIRSLSVSRPLRSLLGIAIFFSFATAVYGLAYPVYFKQGLHMPNYLFGLLGSVSALVGIAGMLAGEKMCARKGYLFALRIFAFLLILSFAALGFFKTAGAALIIFAVIETLIHGWYPLYQSFFNKFVPDAVRASVLSLQSITILAAIACGEIAAGAVLAFTSPSSMIQYGVLPLFVILLMLRKKRFQNGHAG
jgi:MFS family permease